MGPTVTFLLSIGLCLDWTIRVQMDTFSRPTLWAVPSPVLHKGADVTLKCQGHLGCDTLQLWMDEELREERSASGQPTEFVFRSVDWREARSYVCRCGQGPLWSEFSDPLALVVITDGETEAWRGGNFTTPTIGASPGSTVSPGTAVTIWCQVSAQAPSQDYSFALLEAKSLEPLQLQKNAGTRAVFSLQSMRAEDAGSYRCIYYKKTAPYIGSLPSQSLMLTVLGPLPKPTLWAQPGLVMAPGSNVSFWCSRPKLSVLGHVTFTLRKAGTQESLQDQTSIDLWTSFLLPSVGPEDTGSYSCAYRERSSSGGGSESSDALELVVLGSLPRPSLSVIPDLMVNPGKHVSLQCHLPPQTSLWRVTFTLLKAGNPLPLQSQSPSGTWADFHLFSVGAQDAGIYSCVYYGRMAPHPVSEASEALEIWVTGGGPKPSLSVWPGTEVPSGTDVTLLCQRPSWSRSFVLYREREGKILPNMYTTQDGARFFLPQVTSSDSANYSCGLQVSTNGSLWTQHSDPLQLIVKDPMSNNSLIITISCVSLFLLLLCLLLLVFFCQASILTESFQGDSRSRYLCCPCCTLSTCLYHHAVDSSREEVLNTEGSQKRSRQPLVAMTENHQGVFYAQLNINMLSERKSNATKTSTGPIVYATVSND